MASSSLSLSMSPLTVRADGLCRNPLEAVNDKRFLNHVSFGSSQFLAGRQISIASKTSAPLLHSRKQLSVEAKGRRNVPGSGAQTVRMEPKIPQFAADDETAYFSIFIRGKTVKQWYPLSIVSGGPVAKSMMQLMSSDLGRKLYQSTLTRNIASAIYKDADVMSNQAKKAIPLLETQTSFEFGYKIVDKTNPKSSMIGSNVIKIPAEGEMTTVLDRVKEFFSLSFGGESK